MRLLPNFTRLFVVALCCTLSFSVISCSSKNSSSGTGPGSGYDLSDRDLNAEREGRFADGSIPSAEGEGLFRDVFFDFDSSQISDMARQNIEYNAQILQTNPDVKIQLEGHCDERGTAEYNMALGLRRADSVHSILLSYGIPRSRIETISYGEEVPLDPSTTEDAWAKNRRVHFSPFRG